MMSEHGSSSESVKDVLTAKRAREIVFRSFDFAQGEEATHKLMNLYFRLVHPAWKVGTELPPTLVEGHPLHDALQSKVESRGHVGIAHDEFEYTADQMAMLLKRTLSTREDALMRQFDEEYKLHLKDATKEERLDRVRMAILFLMVMSDYAYRDGRPEHKDGGLHRHQSVGARHTSGHGRKYMSYVCDYIINGLTPPGDGAFAVMMQDLSNLFARLERGELLPLARHIDDAMAKKNNDAQRQPYAGFARMLADVVRAHNAWVTQDLNKGHAGAVSAAIPHERVAFLEQMKS